MTWKECGKMFFLILKVIYVQLELSKSVNIVSYMRLKQLWLEGGKTIYMIGY